MTQTDPAPDPAVPPALQDDKTMPVVVYALYLAALVSAGMTSVVGVILAYVSKGAAPEWIQSHYVFQIRTFWLSLLFGLIGLVLTPVGIGFVILPAVGIWVAVRCILGLSWLLKSQAYPTPRNWMI
ncbi:MULTISPECIES: DUF4870 family protein [Caulobacter]|jgi:uncharacterized membrane protein|uniref:Membrane protein n=1 Tax=Caulobacter rhizosphaerae TaxID=2010972 RepID=A0ABU1N3T1_9CAUL|nr:MULTISPECIES: hypothetical protein [Caulobacter]KQZ27424.1 hypothetical protein ASD47_05255 [Caulobacter sp. Root1472]MDR6533103.1 putative membrane protein [Caulobacter rhizosphaerae]GGL33419.1 hypothetical protein GCM10010983_33170 [Caulobacter rhizosphaerae]